MDDLSGAGSAGIALGAVCIGLGLALMVSQHVTRTSLSIGSAYVALGSSIMIGIPLWNHVDPDHPGWLAHAFGVFPAGVVAASASYLMGLLETAEAPPPVERRIRWFIKFGYGLAAVLVLLGALFPVEHLNEYSLSLGDDDFVGSKGFWVFGTYYIFVGLVFGTAWLLLAFKTRLDVGERVRAIVAAVMSPLLTMLSLVPLPVSVTLLGFVVVLGTYGQFRYLVAVGERGAFLSRFLSSQVAESVRLEGLSSVMQPGSREVTIVACDLRGFTAYAEAVPSQAVIDLLADYYDAVGDAVAEVDGTVKDYAGDGVLIVVGAPLPQADHATLGLTLARRLHELVAPVLRHWSTQPHPLGMGVGVASGPVTAGALGSSSRMEYTVVGTPVNLAARLCSAARHGETLVAASTVELSGTDGLEARAPMAIKGLAADQTVYAL